MKDCTFITNQLLEKMILEKKYDLDELYRMIEAANNDISDCRHKVRSVLARRVISKRYRIKYHQNSTYSLEKTRNSEKREVC